MIQVILDVLTAVSFDTKKKLFKNQNTHLLQRFIVSFTNISTTAFKLMLINIENGENE